MHRTSLCVLLRALLCLQQVSGRVVARDGASVTAALVSNKASEAHTRSCSSSEEHTELRIRDRRAEPNECEELFEIDNGADEQELKQLEAGDFDGLLCAAVLTGVLVKYATNPGWSGKLGRRDEDGAPKADCQRARDIVLRQKIPEPCRKIKNIEFGMALSDDYWSGTYDKVAGTIEGSAGKSSFSFAEAPSRGTQKWVPMNMKESFGSDVIDINGIDKITLTAQGEFWKLSSAKNDKFQVQDIKIRAQCAEPGFEARNDKFVGLNAWYGHPGGWLLAPFKEKTVASFPIALGDWSFAPPCSVIRDLNYDFKVANSQGAGTFDKLSFTLGKGKEIFLGESVSAGFTKAEAIDLKKTYDKDTVDIRDLKDLAIGDAVTGNILSGDAWTFQGITFSATCADTSKKMQMKKFESVNQDVKHVDNAPVWTGEINPQDWVEVS